ncbi:MAG: DUF2189 domain-containing protein [Sphingomonadaceae bacterium]|nr:DUF2189 domain-containing protein [Sphingomonadaceae bacterium]
MAVAQYAEKADVRQEIPIRDIGLHDLRVALSQGWEDFIDRRGDLILIGAIYPVAVLFAFLFAFKISILPIIFPLFAGSALLGPIVATGYYEIARRRERGIDARWSHFFDVLKGPSGFAIFSLATVFFLLFVVWVMVAFAIYATTMGNLPPEQVRTAGDFIAAIFSTSEGSRMLVIGNLAGAGFAIVALGLSLVSFPMLVDKPVRLSTALRTSVRVALKNPMTTLVWGVIVVALLILGALPALVGLAVVLPVLGYSTWHLYTRAVER